jgi:hypothetical protein
MINDSAVTVSDAYLSLLFCSRFDDLTTPVTVVTAFGSLSLSRERSSPKENTPLYTQNQPGICCHCVTNAVNSANLIRNTSDSKRHCRCHRTSDCSAHYFSMTAMTLMTLCTEFRIPFDPNYYSPLLPDRLTTIHFNPPQDHLHAQT